MYASCAGTLSEMPLIEGKKRDEKGVDFGQSDQSKTLIL